MRIVPHYQISDRTIDRAIERLRAGRQTRRDALRLLGGAGLATAGAMTLGRRAVAQDDGTPSSMATPQLGPRPDGTTLWRVKVGDMRMEEHLELMDYFPGELTINAGDAIWFDFGMGAFHTVTFLAGGELPPLFIPDPELGTPVPDEPPQLILNPAVVLPQGGEAHDGTGYVNSGIDVFRDPTQPYVVTFPAPGTYDYLCVVHASVMKARVVVQAAGAALPTDQAGYDQIAADEIAALYDRAPAEIAPYQTAASSQNADGTTTWEVTVGAGGESELRVQAFLPDELAIKVGDTVRWVHRAPGEPHTISFIGAGETPPEDLSVEIFADGTPKFVQNNETFLAQGGNVWSGTGWLNSGFIGIPQIGLPMEFAVTFDTPGDFIYYCALHGDAQGNGMAAKLTVTPR
jgi:plastocyanin